MEQGLSVGVNRERAWGEGPGLGNLEWVVGNRRELEKGGRSRGEG